MIFRRDNDDFHSTSLWQSIIGPFRKLGRTFGELIEGDDSMSMDDTFTSRVMGFVWLPFRLLGAFLSFMIHSWTATRSGVAFIRSLPVLVVLVLFFGVLLLEDLINTEGRLISTNSAYMARQRQMFPDRPGDAQMFAQKLVEIKPDDPNHKYQLGLSKEDSGYLTDAFDIMRSIAPETEVGFANAHIWLSQYYARTKSIPMSDDERDDIVQKHLGFAVQAEPENQLAQMNLADMHVKRAARSEKGSPAWLEETKKAVEHLSNVANGSVNLYQIRAVPIMAELRLQYEPEELVFRRLAAEVIRLEPIARKNPENIQIWLGMVRCSVLMKDYTGALDIVQRGYQAARTANAKRSIMQLASQIYLSSTEDFRDLASLDSYRKCINALCEAVRVNPVDRTVCLRLLDFIGMVPPGADVGGRPPVNEQWLRDSIVGSKIPGVIHALIGMHEISKGKVIEGEKHWRIAQEQFSSADLVINNLIFVATNDRSAEFPHLLDMITLAIEMFPEQHSLYQTRGIYLSDNQRFPEAVQDFKVAIEKMPAVVTNHKLLMNCYEKLGDEENAVIQEKIIERKLGEMDSRKRAMVSASMKRLDERE